MISPSTPGVEQLGSAIATLRSWQQPEAPFQLHPGDLGWNRMFFGDATAERIRWWRDGSNGDGEVLALGMFDDENLLRLAIRPDLQDDRSLAQTLATDLAEAGRIFTSAEAYLELPNGVVLREAMLARGWELDDPWAVLSCDLAGELGPISGRFGLVPDVDVSIRTAVHRAAFGSDRFTDECWRVMSAGEAYRDARCLVLFDDEDNAVGAATVWAAGPGSTGVLEPLGVDPRFRGHGHGRELARACAIQLQQLGASRATVATPAANTVAVAAYVSAGYHREADRYDLRRA